MSAPKQGPIDWPPTAERIGGELGPWFAVLLAPLAWLISIGLALLAPQLDRAGDPSVEAVVQQGLAPEVIQVVLWLSLVAVLGWWSACGLHRRPGPIEPRWTVVPTAVLALVFAATLGSLGSLRVGAGVLVAVSLWVYLSAFVEELVFRGIMLHALSRAWGGVAGVWISSALFALVHIPTRLGGIAANRGSIAFMVVAYFGAGVVLCRIRAAGSIWWSTAVHTLVNAATYAVLWAGTSILAPLGLLKLGISVLGVCLAIALIRRGRRGSMARSIPARPDLELASPLVPVPRPDLDRWAG